MSISRTKEFLCMLIVFFVYVNLWHDKLPLLMFIIIALCRGVIGRTPSPPSFIARTIHAECTVQKKRPT